MPCINIQESEGLGSTDAGCIQDTQSAALMPSRVRYPTFRAKVLRHGGQYNFADPEVGASSVCDYLSMLAVGNRILYCMAMGHRTPTFALVFSLCCTRFLLFQCATKAHV